MASTSANDPEASKTLSERLELLQKKIGGETEPIKPSVVKPVLTQNASVVMRDAAISVSFPATLDSGLHPDPWTMADQLVRADKKDISVQTTADLDRFFTSSEMASTNSQDMHADTQTAFHVVNSISPNDSKLSHSEGLIYMYIRIFAVTF